MKTLDLQHNVVSILYSVKGMIETHLSCHEERRFDSKDEALEHAQFILKKIYKQASRSLEITRRIRLAVQAEKKPDAPAAGSDVRKSWKKAVKILSQQESMRELDVIDPIPDVFPLIKCYEKDLIEIFYTLAQNAVQAMRKQGKLIIRANIQYDSGSPEAVITVSDTGPGVPQEVLGRLFDAFFTTKPLEEGNGLGLCLVKGLVKNNGGKISVSSFEGCGTTFSMTFQLAEMKEHQSPLHI